ncbi:MAG TPA: amidohydrolase family protein [Candidatus Binataceae bacterium]|nr:amidohydrolase family protein [Candidatus Binataceae bacterium]
MSQKPLVIDADGHILEAADYAEKYLEEKYRSRAIRIRRDGDGLEFLEYDGKPAAMLPHGILHTLGAMGCEPAQLAPSKEKSYAGSAPFGSMSMKERIELLDQEGIDKAILYPTIGLLWEAEVEDPEITVAYCRAYNRWIADFCRDSGGRLIPIAHLSLLDIPAAVVELERAVKDGCRGAFVAPFNHARRAHGHPDHDPLFAKFQELDVPFAIHPTFEPVSLMPRRFTELERAIWYHQIMACHACQIAFTTLFSFGVFDKFPRLKTVVLESGAGWIGYWVDRMDALYEVPINRAQLKNPPSHYIRTQCWFSADPDERAIAGLAKFIGDDRFFWASDFPHSDHGREYMKELHGLLGRMPEPAAAKLAGRNVAELYGI